MSYVDIAIAVGFFLFFVALVIGVSTKYLVEIPSSMSIEEYRDSAMRIFNQFFTTSGTPENWEESSDAPSELGLANSIYKVSVSVEEPGIYARANESVITHIVFDEECSGKVWADTIRVYDSNIKGQAFELVEPVYCSGGYINESYVRFNVNISQSVTDYYYVFYSGDSEIPGVELLPTYFTDSWISHSGDSWTESASGWSGSGGQTSTPSANSEIKIQGLNSVQIEDSPQIGVLGLSYSPGSPITGVSNGWYLDYWMYIDDVSGISHLTTSVSDGTSTITKSIPASSITSGEWYHFERELTPALWDVWGTFNASNGITEISVHTSNYTASSARKMMIDQLHFELAPLSVHVYPEEVQDVISMKKLSALNNLTYEDLRDATGENYKFRIEIVE